MQASPASRQPSDYSRADASARVTSAVTDAYHLLQDELNVKGVSFASDLTAFGSFRLQIDAKALGPKLGPKMKDVLAATRSGAWKLQGDRAEIGERMNFARH